MTKNYIPTGIFILLSSAFFSVSLNAQEAPRLASGEQMSPLEYAEAVEYIQQSRVNHSETQAQAMGKISINFTDGLDQVFGRFKENALNAVESCDYANYLQVIQGLAGTWSTVNNFIDTEDDGGANRVIPFMDPINTFITPFATDALDVSSKIEVRNAILMFEDLCNLVVGARDMKRSADAMKRKGFGIKEAFLLLLGEDLGLGETLGGPSLGEQFAGLYSVIANDRPTTGTDTVYAVVAEVLGLSFESSGSKERAVADLGSELDKSVDALYTYAVPNDDEDDPATWKCPDGYPDFDEAAMERRTTSEGLNKFVCGPAPPEQSNRVTAEMKARQMQMEGLRLDNDAKALELQATSLMLETHERKQADAALVKSIRVF